MFIIRAVREEDLEDLYDLSKLVLFINLPRDKKIIESKIKKSLISFEKPSDDFSQNHYVFVLEDTTDDKIVGVSMIHAQHGTEQEPHYYLKVSQENKFSKTINTGFIHGTLKLGLNTNGPTEIGGLIVHPDYRGNPYKLGKQLSFVRFFYMGLHKNRFKSEVHSELMPPLDSDGNSPLWEAIGRRFMNMDYHEADILSRKNKEFILSLFPSEVIYETLLPYDARDSIGKVGDDTLPVKKMLESVGFTYTDEVDPFDGGPHYRASLNEIKPIKKIKNVKIKKRDTNMTGDEQSYLVNITKNKNEFSAVMLNGIEVGDTLFISAKEFDALELTSEKLMPTMCVTKY